VDENARAVGDDCLRRRNTYRGRFREGTSILGHVREHTGTNGRIAGNRHQHPGGSLKPAIGGRKDTETRPVVLVGTLSYSLYIWQQPFLDPHGALWICRWPQNIVFVAAAAVASYFLVERAFLRLKDRIGQRATSPVVLMSASSHCVSGELEQVALSGSN
jgi:hypothetical protein